MNPNKIQKFQKLFFQGTLLLRNGDPEGARLSYEAALKIAPRDFDTLHMLGLAYATSEFYDKAASLLKRALSIDPMSPEANMHYGNILNSQGQFELALKYQKKAASLSPQNPSIHYNLANSLRDAGHPQEAIDRYRHTLELKPNYLEALNNLATLLVLHADDYAAAAECCARMVSGGSKLPYLHGRLRHLKAQYCDWSNYDEECADVLHRVDQQEVAASPFSILAIPSTALQQKLCAQIAITEEFPASRQSSWQGSRYAHSRIRIGYFSADFFAHATAFLMAELLEKHDRSRFEIFVFSFSGVEHHPIRNRLATAVEHFIEVSKISPSEIAKLARQNEIDIAIDLKGFTQARRTEIFAQRCAPIQINYLGYPGTMGAPFIDYIIADHILIPPGQEEAYTEKVVRLPNSYQPNDSQRPIAVDTPSRRELGLPDNGFVFCCFNNNYKITPDVFDIWMRIITRVENSVLWLFEDNPAAAANLRNEARRRNVDPNRVIFAPRVPLEEHLARHRCADLFLDTFYCNAHTTASDALWAGLPILTRIGNTFASRVAASLLNAVGLPELIVTTAFEYETLALKLASDPILLRKFRNRLIEKHTQHALFDATRYTQNLERAFLSIWAQHEQGLSINHLNIEDQTIV
ncbi:MAG TPA: tetratricopeptide repeat protein [Rhodocyclaceae bacterium]|nr:tetratricopeptide repeat protein [Rhodocyclaceae bacterium]